jgi:hypothetical protein
MKPLLLITLLVLCLHRTNAQDSLTVEQIDRITAAIDGNKKSTKDTYCDTLQLEQLTHYCEESVRGEDGKRLHRFTIRTTTNKQTLTVYYFHQNELVKVLNEEKSKGKVLKRRVLYYHHKQVIHDIAEGIHPSHEYFLQTAEEKVKELTSTASN